MKFKFSFLLFISGFFSIAVFSQTTLVYNSGPQKFNTALELYDKQRYVAARDMFKEYINDNQLKDGYTEDAEFYISMCAIYLENDGAENQLENFITSHPGYSKNNKAYYKLGLNEFSKNNYDKSIIYLIKVRQNELEKDEKAELQYKLAYAYFSKQKFNEAGEIFNSLKNTESPYAADANYYAGYLAYKDNKFEQAVKDLQKAGAGAAYKSQVPYLICGVYAKQKKYDEVINIGEKALQDKGTQNQEEIKLLLADAYFRKKNYKKTISYLNQTKGKLGPEQQYQLGFSQYKVQDYKNSITTLEKIASGKDSLGQISAYYLGLSYIQTDNKLFAARALDVSRKGKFGKEIQQESTFLYGKLNYGLGNFTEAINVLKNFNATYPGSKYENEVNELLADAYLDSDNYDAAVAHLEGVKKKTPRINAAYQRVTFNKGVELFNQNKYKESITQFLKSSQTYPDNDAGIASQFWVAESYATLKNYNEAGKYYNKVIQNASSKNSPFYIKSKYGLGYVYYNNKDYPKALNNFKDYVANLKSAPDKQNYNDAVLRVADCYYVTKQYASAEEYYDMAIEKNTSVDYALYQKGLALNYNNKSKDAKLTFDQLLKKYNDSPFYDDALYQRGNIDFEQGNYEPAVATFTKLINEKPNSEFVPYALLKRASASNNQKKYDNAIDDYKKILTEYASHPSSNDALTGLRDALANSGKSDELSGILSTYKNANPNASSTESIEFEAAKDLYFNEKYEKAVHSLGKFLNDYPGGQFDIDAKYYLADSYLRTNDLENAVKYFEQVGFDKKSNFAGKAVLKAGEIYLRQNKFEKSVFNFRQSLILSKSKKDQIITNNGLLEAYYNLSKYDSVIYFANKLISDGSVSQQHKAELYKGKAALSQNDFNKAADYFLNVINIAQDEYGAEAQYLTGEIYYKQQKYKQSLEALFEVNKKFESYDLWKGKAFLLIADNYIALKENFQAKATLKSIIDNSDDKDLVEAARKKLNGIIE